MSQAPDEPASTEPWTPPFSEDGIEASAIRGRLAARLFGASPEVVRIGRYEVVDRIGAGGMGVVYSARDPELGRLVALKVLSGPRGRDPRQRQRLVDEARALARLSHPHVVQIHEVGEHEGSIYLALELVEGETLARWQRRAGRRWQEILAAYLDAARGLGAAHGVGVIHRDVKPANILIGVDGRVRVVDFGLARARAEATESGEADPASATREESVGVAGTPAYMSPEQAAGRDLDARSDVFSLCIALFEGLCGVRPFARDDPGDLSRGAALDVCVLRASIPRGARVPSWVLRILARGLEPDRRRRIATMAALVADFEAAPRRIRRRRAAIGVALGLALGAAGIAALPPGASVCPEVVDTLPGAWDSEARARVQRRFDASGLPFADLAWRHVAASLDATVIAWGRARRAACIQTRVDRTHSEEHLDLSAECLRRHERAIDDLVAHLEEGGPAVVIQAHVLVRQLDDPARCTSPDVLRHGPPPPPPGLRERVDALRRGLDEVRFLTVTAAYEAAIERADALVDAAAIDPLLHAEAIFLRGVVDVRRGAWEDAGARLSRAAALAEGLHDDRLALAIFGELTELATHGRRDLAAARIYADLAGAKLRRVGAKGIVRADHLDRLGELELAEANAAAALREHEEAAALRPADDLVGRARSLKGAANALAELGQIDASIERLTGARDLLTRELGAAHPATAIVDFNLALSLRERADATPADLERAEGLLRGALAVEVRHGGDDGLGTARVRVALADVLGARGEVEAALVELAQARAVLQDRGMPTGDELANALALAVNLNIDRRAWAAAAESTAALIRLLRARGEPIPAEFLINAGEFHLRVGDWLAATPYFDQALALVLAEEPPDPRLWAHALNGRGKVYLIQGDPALARALFERALDLVDVIEAPAAELRAEVLWGAAQALIGTGGPRSQARRLAAEALPLFAAVDPGAPEVAVIEAFLVGRR